MHAESSFVCTLHGKAVIAFTDVFELKSFWTFNFNKINQRAVLIFAAIGLRQSVWLLVLNCSAHICDFELMRTSSVRCQHQNGQPTRNYFFVKFCTISAVIRCKSDETQETWFVLGKCNVSNFRPHVPGSFVSSTLDTRLTLSAR